MADFLFKDNDNELVIKLLEERCLECFICVMFFSSSLTVSIKTLSEKNLVNYT